MIVTDPLGQPFVSVVIPTYQRRKLVLRAVARLASILARDARRSAQGRLHRG